MDKLRQEFENSENYYKKPKKLSIFNSKNSKINLSQIFDKSNAKATSMASLTEKDKIKDREKLKSEKEKDKEKEKKRLLTTPKLNLPQAITNTTSILSSPSALIKFKSKSSSNINQKDLIPLKIPKIIKTEATKKLPKEVNSKNETPNIPSSQPALSQNLNTSNDTNKLHSQSSHNTSQASIPMPTPHTPNTALKLRTKKDKIKDDKSWRSSENLKSVNSKNINAYLSIVQNDKARISLKYDTTRNSRLLQSKTSNLTDIRKFWTETDRSATRIIIPHSTLLDPKHERYSRSKSVMDIGIYFRREIFLGFWQIIVWMHCMMTCREPQLK